jgi:hypothetical protein
MIYKKIPFLAGVTLNINLSLTATDGDSGGSFESYEEPATYGPYFYGYINNNLNLPIGYLKLL